MAAEAEAGDTGGAGVAEIAGHLGRDAIEAAHASDGARERLVARHAILPRGGDDAGAEGLGEKEPIAWPETALDEHAGRVHAPGDAEAIFRLGVDDGVT